MLRLSETRDKVKVVNDQHGIPTSCVDLSSAIAELIEEAIDQDEVGGILHFSSPRDTISITWADFAREIFAKYGKNIRVIDCSSSEYPTKAKRPEWSVLKNNSNILLPDWKIGLARYLGK
jgi:dTDP-4-dehydrorhamnose reductase